MFVLNTKAEVKEASNIKVNGLNARRMITEISDEQSTIRIVSYFIKKGNNVFVFHGYTTPDKYSSYAKTFTGTMGQFRNLTDQKKINVSPMRLRVKRTSAQGTLQQALQKFGVPQDKFEEMAILNGRELNEMLPANSFVKIVSK